jgi:uncharacterized membrane protein
MAGVGVALALVAIFVAAAFFILLIVGGIIWLVRSDVHRDIAATETQEDRTLRTVLDERLARSEVGFDEYDDARKKLEQEDEES